MKYRVTRPCSYPHTADLSERNGHYVCADSAGEAAAKVRANLLRDRWPVDETVFDVQVWDGSNKSEKAVRIDLRGAR